MSTSQVVTIQVMGTRYPIQCQENEIVNLEKSAAYINTLIQDIKKDSPNLAREKMLVLASLTLCERLFTAEKEKQADTDASLKILQEIISDTTASLHR